MNNDDITLIPQIRMMESVNKNQKAFIQKAVENHPNWDELLRHDLIHHCLMQEDLPIRQEDESESIFKRKLIEFRRRLDEQNRLASCCIQMIDMIDKLEKKNNREK